MKERKPEKSAPPVPITHIIRTMRFLQFLTPTSLWWLFLCSSTIATEIPYNAQIEIDVLFPRNETYNNLSRFPVVLAIQDVKSAYRFEWDISWKLYNATPGASDADYISGYGSDSIFSLNDFQWYFDDVAVVPMLGYNFTTMKAGSYRLEWEYSTTPCTTRPPNTIVYNILEVIASGVQFFSVVEDGSGLDFEIPVDECPAFSGSWAVRESTSLYCPFLGDSDDGDRDPCKAKLQNEKQVECIRDYLFEGTVEVPNNETEACRSAFKRADVAWLEPLSTADGPSQDEDEDEDEEEDGNDNDNDSSRSSETSTNKQEDAGDFAVSHRPSLFCVAVMGLLAVAAI